MRHRITTILFLVYILVFVNCSYFGKFSAPYSLAENLRLQMRTEEFEKMYDESSEFVQRNATKEEFITSMKKIVTEMKKIDADINWRENFDLGSSTGFHQQTKSITYYAFREIGQEANKVVLFMYWSDESGTPKLFGATAFLYQNGEQQFHIDAIHGIIYQK